MTNYARQSGFARKSRTSILTPQSQPIAGRESEMSPNNAGGFTFAVDNFTRTRRFIIIGAEGSTYYTNQKALVKQNAQAVQKAIAEDPHRVVDMVVEILGDGRAFKPDPGLFVLALVASYRIDEKLTGAAEIEAAAVRQYALDALPKVARIATHMFHFLTMVQEMRGWGRSLRRAFANWYTNQSVEKLAVQAFKYKSRDGVSHRDVLRLAHPSTDDPVRARILGYMAKGVLPTEDSQRSPYDTVSPLQKIAAAEELLHITGTDKASVARAVLLIRTMDLPHEVVPPALKNDPHVWEALSEKMPMIATLRNLNKMTAVGLVAPLSTGASTVIARLTDADAIAKSRAHPIQFLIAANQYAQGHGEKGSLTWNPVPAVTEAINEGFYASFGNVPITGLPFLIALDTSSSMQGGRVMNTSFTPMEMGAAMALVHLRTEPNSHLIGFNTSYHEIPVSKNIRLDAMIQTMRQFRGGGTNTSLPMQYLVDRNLRVNTVVSYTDNETWAGCGYVTEYMSRYRNLFSQTRFMNCNTTSGHSSDVDPNNAQMFELHGFDANTPRLIAEYSLGRV